MQVVHAGLGRYVDEQIGDLCDGIAIKPRPFVQESHRMHSYDRAQDFERVSDFLVRHYRPDNCDGNWLQPAWALPLASQAAGLGLAVFLAYDRVPQDVAEALLARDVLGGLPLGDYYPGMDNSLLVCATEKRSASEIASYAHALEEVLA